MKMKFLCGFPSSFPFKELGFTKIIVLVILCSLFFYDNASADTGHTGMRNITSMQLVADMGVGWNLGNTLDAHGNWVSGLATETAWGNPKTTKAMIDLVKQKGFKAMRLPVTWYQHIGGAPNYTIDAAWLNRVEEVANYAFANNMYVIINVHHDDSWVVPTYARQAAATAQLQKIWTQIANRFKNYGDYLIFETLNEPRLVGSPEEWNGGTAEGRDVVNKFNLAAVNAIRATGGNNSSRHIMAPGYAASSASVVIDNYVVPNNDSRVIVSCHNYAPYSFCLQDPGTNTWGTATDKSNLDADMERVKNKFINNGRAVVMGEWGSKDKNNTTARATHARYYASAAKSRKITPVVWDDGGDFTLLNRGALNWKYAQIADAIVGPVQTNVFQLIKRNAPSFAMDGNFGGADGQNVYLWTFNSSEVNQKWVEINRGGGYYTYKKLNTNYCLDGGNGGANGQNVYLWTCNDLNQNQHWKKVDAGAGHYRLEKRNAPGFSIDGGNGGANNQNVFLWTSNHANQNQHWKFNATSSAAKEATMDDDDLEEVDSQKIVTYPNPVIDKLTIHLSENPSDISIYSVDGKQVRMLRTDKGVANMDMSDLASGLYFLKLVSNGKVLTQKIVKK